MTEADTGGVLVVFQDRKWVGDLRLGAFTVAIDGVRTGVARVQGEVSAQVSPGRHTVRIRQWWYRSPSVDVDVPEGQTVRMRADVDMSVGRARRVGRMLLRPSRSLTLTPT